MHKTKKQPLISFLVPCKNNQRDIVEALTILDAWGSAQKHSYEIIVVLFHTDVRLRESLARYTALIQNARIVEYKTPREGTLIQQALLDANGLIRMWITRPSCASCITAYQEIEQQFRGGTHIVMTRTRIPKKKIGVRIARLYTELFLKTPILFPFEGCVSFSQKAVLALFPHMKLRSRGVLSESFIKARDRGFVIQEVLLDKTDFCRSSMALRDLKDIIYLTIELWINMLLRKIRTWIGHKYK